MKWFFVRSMAGQRHFLFYLFSLVFLCGLSGLKGFAQPPTTLRYPTPVVYEAQVDSIYLAPTVSGLVNTYSISPALPAGLTLNTNTGIITGRATGSSPATLYTVTATNTEGSTTGTFSLQVIKTFYSAGANDSIKFLNANAVVKVNNAPLSDTARSRKGGRQAGDIVLYQNVITLSGTPIDCIVRTVRVTKVGDWRAYDMDTVAAAGFNNNHPAFFSPMINFLNGGGSILFNFQFILGGTYNDTTYSGTNITLQNIKLNTYDLDGNNSPNSKQYNSFKGFSSAELGNPSLIATSFDNVTGRTRFESTTDTNISNILDPRTRVRVSYQNVSNFDVEVGSITNGAAYFFLNFSAGQNFSTVVNTSVPAVDLNTVLPGNVQVRSGCGVSLAFTEASQSNIQSAADLNALEVRFPAAEIKDGASEQLAFDGTATVIPLNFTSTTATVTINGVTYAVTGSTDTAAIRTLSFTRSSGGVMTAVEAEALLDALRFNNNAATPTPGERNFTVNIRNDTYRSPDAIFSATLTCVTLAGHIYRDANGLADGKVNAVGVPLAANSLYAVLTQMTDSTVVLPPQPIAADGSFSFGTATEGVYSLYFVPQSAAPAVGTVLTASILPTAPAGTGAFVFTGENLSGEAGNDGLADGKLIVTLGSRGVSNANFGIEQMPVVSNVDYSPAGWQPVQDTVVTLDGTAFPALSGTDPEDGALDATTTTRTIRIDTLPANGTLLYNGNTISTGQTIASFNPALLQLKFTGSGYTSTRFAYAYVDQAGVASAPAAYRLSWSRPLPVTLLSFEVQPSHKGARLSWRTGSEIQNKGFQIEHSTDARRWSVLDFIDSKAPDGTSAVGAAYEYSHTLPEGGLHYYRLLQKDYNGMGQYSPVRSIRLTSPGAALAIFPNPASGAVMISGLDITAVRIQDAQGRYLSVPTFQQPDGSWILRVAALPEGVYALSVFRKNNVETHRLLIAR